MPEKFKAEKPAGEKGSEKKPAKSEFRVIYPERAVDEVKRARHARQAVYLVAQDLHLSGVALREFMDNALVEKVAGKATEDDKILREWAREKEVKRNERSEAELRQMEKGLQFLEGLLKERMAQKLEDEKKRKGGDAQSEFKF